MLIRDLYRGSTTSRRGVMTRAFFYFNFFLKKLSKEISLAYTKSLCRVIRVWKKSLIKKCGGINPCTIKCRDISHPIQNSLKNFGLTRRQNMLPATDYIKLPETYRPNKFTISQPQARISPELIQSSQLLIYRQ